MDNWRVFNLVMGIGFRHPTVSSLVMQTYKNWMVHQDAVNNTVSMWQAGLAKISDPMDYAGLVGSITKANPAVPTLLVQTLGLWKNHIDEGIQCLTEFQAGISQIQ